MEIPLHIQRKIWKYHHRSVLNDIKISSNANKWHKSYTLQDKTDILLSTITDSLVLDSPIKYIYLIGSRKGKTAATRTVATHLITENHNNNNIITVEVIRQNGIYKFTNVLNDKTIYVFHLYSMLMTPLNCHEEILFFY